MTFLNRVIEQKKSEILEKKVNVSKNDLQKMATEIPVRDLRAAISGERRIIAEIKKRSPRVNRFRNADAVHDLSRLYEKTGAAAVSIVTDALNFGTSLDDARRVRERISLPILVKDFVLDEYQVHEARAFGADGLLLIARILEAEKLADLRVLTGELGMQALVEVHDEIDLKKAIDAGARIIGINNRDLDSLEVRLDTTRRLVGHIPAGTTIVSESGIEGPAEILELSRLGVNAFLVGGALLEAEDPGLLLRELLGKGETKH
jgi:indole-3-glycerol phosphate synthase